MYLGVDLGTSALKVLLVDDHQRVVGEASVPLRSGHPRPLWSEQDPAEWWDALCRAVAELRGRCPTELAQLRAIGMSGQMYGATLLDAWDRPLRPCILWNDGRSALECAELEAREPAARRITGNLAMPGFTAPKLLWVRRHEPDIFAATRSILLPKDYLRLRMTGVRATDVSDAAGTLWLDVGSRVWSADMITATDLRLSMMPELFEGNEPTATLLPEIADAWGIPRTAVVAAGAGDNAAAAIGVGAIEASDGFVSIGTSGVVCEIDDRFAPNVEGAIHTFCHCLPGRWLRMAVILSAAASLAWLRQVAGALDEAVLAAEAEAADPRSEVMLLPYLAGERTPHNDPEATGAFVGLRLSTGRGELARAVMEGVALALADGRAAFGPSRTPERPLWAAGGGARSPLWLQMIADAPGRSLAWPDEAGEFGPAFGAARLARLAVTGEAVSSVCTAGQGRMIATDPDSANRFAARLVRFRRLYQLQSALDH